MLFLMMVILIGAAASIQATRHAQGRRAAAMLLFVSMLSVYIPAGSAAKAEEAGGSTLENDLVWINSLQRGEIGAVTYSQSGDAYVIDAASQRVRVGSGDVIAFSGMIAAPEGKSLSWMRVDIYDADTLEPYTEGAEHYRAENLSATGFDLELIPPLEIGNEEAEFILEEGKRYVVMLCVGDSDGQGFADLDKDIEGDQGPAILVDVRVSPMNCDHPHSARRYALHSSGATRAMNYGDPLTHQIELLYERYCGLCDSYRWDIWGQGTAEEHEFTAQGMCAACGYDGLVNVLTEEPTYTVRIPTEMNLNARESQVISVDGLPEGGIAKVTVHSENGGYLKFGDLKIPYTFEESLTFTEERSQPFEISVNSEAAADMPAGTYTDTLNFSITVSAGE